MKYGMNLLLWTGEMNDSMLPVLKLLKNLGYDGVELPIFNTALDYKKWGKILDDHGLERTAVTFTDGAAVERCARRLAALTGRRLDQAAPYVDGRLPGGVRLHAVAAELGRGWGLPLHRPPECGHFAAEMSTLVWPFEAAGSSSFPH